MKLHLISENRQIRELCQEVFFDILGSGWTLHAGADLATANDANLYLWDIDTTGPQQDLPAITPHDAWRHFFLVERPALESVRDRLPLRDVSILLKPVTKAALAAFLTDACRAAVERDCAEPGGVEETLRVDRDLLLQCFMQANLRLQEYDSDRTNFLARAIHDFRAPLTALTGYCGLLLGEEVGHLSDHQREVLQRMHHCARKLSNMASAMLQLSIWPRVDAKPDLHRGDIQECIDQAVHEILPIAQGKRISVSVEAAAPSEPLLFERMKVEQVLVNLLENACRFVPRGGTIRLGGYPWFWERRRSAAGVARVVCERRAREDRTPNAYRIDVRDSGPGIASDDVRRIFEEYTSYAGGSDRSGGGLGLAICRMIVNQHKGRIWAETAPSGAVFSFVLPFCNGELAAGIPTDKAFGAGAS